MLCPACARIRLTFSEAHLARDVGEALHKAYEGDLDYHYADEDIMPRTYHSIDCVVNPINRFSNSASGSGRLNTLPWKVAQS